MNRIQRTAIAGAITATGVLLAACGSSSGDTSGAGNRMSTSPMSSMPMTPGGPMSTGPAEATGSLSTSEHNAADVEFATNMIPHHAQAVYMAGMAARQAGTAQVKDLAEGIRAAQAPEIDKMSGWLAEWGEPVPSATYTPGHGGHDSMPMPGMMGDEEMASLGAAHGTEFDRMWLQMMISHHQGAISMANSELAEGASAQAKTLASAIITGQSNEIDRMNALLDSLG